jgi:hypothetical protein
MFLSHPGGEANSLKKAHDFSMWVARCFCVRRLSTRIHVCNREAPNSSIFVPRLMCLNKLVHSEDRAAAYSVQVRLNCGCTG